MVTRVRDMCKDGQMWVGLHIVSRKNKDWKLDNAIIKGSKAMLKLQEICC